MLKLLAMYIFFYIRMQTYGNKVIHVHAKAVSAIKRLALDCYTVTVKVAGSCLSNIKFFCEFFFFIKLISN